MYIKNIYYILYTKYFISFILYFIVYIENFMLHYLYIILFIILNLYFTMIENPGHQGTSWNIIKPSHPSFPGASTVPDWWMPRASALVPADHFAAPSWWRRRSSRRRRLRLRAEGESRGSAELVDGGQSSKVLGTLPRCVELIAEKDGTLGKTWEQNKIYQDIKGKQPQKDDVYSGILV